MIGDGNANNTIGAIVDVVVYERSSNAEYNYIQLAISYGAEVKSSEIYDGVIARCKEKYGDDVFYRIKNILKWNI